MTNSIRHYQVQYASLLENLYLLAASNPLYQCSRYLRSGLIAVRVHYPAA